MKTTSGFITLFLLLSSVAFGQEKDSNYYSLSLVHERNYFDRAGHGTWQTTSITVGRVAPSYGIFVRAAAAQRFGARGWQLETEAYPKFKGWYAYVAAAYGSDPTVFSRWRYGASAYIPFAGKWEAEAGFRQLAFEKAVRLVSAGISRYVGSWLFNVRTFQGIGNSSSAWLLSARKYWKDKNYIWCQAGQGLSPDESRSLLLSADDRLNTRRVDAGINLAAGNRWTWQMSLGFSADKLPGEASATNQYAGTTGLVFSF